MSYLDRETYQKLYVRYTARLGRPVSDLLDLAGDLTNKTVIDICGGAGEMSIEAKKRGAKTVLLIDGDENMMDMQALDDSGIYFMYLDMRNLLLKYILECECAREPGWEREDCCCFQCESDFSGADAVVCRQAVNYWLWDERIAKKIAQLMHSGGKFIFNTFNHPPSEVPRVKEYEMGTGACLIGGELEWSKFVEVSWLVGDVCHHIQIREGMEPHHTNFKWITPEQFREYLEPYFEVEETKDSYTSIYCCTKK